MISYLKQYSFPILMVVIIQLHLNCAGSDIEIKENIKENEQLISKGRSYWDQRIEPEALNKAEDLIVKILKIRPNDLESSVLLGKIKYTQANFLEKDPIAISKLFFDAKEICKKAVLSHPDFSIIYDQAKGDSTFKLLSALTDAPESILPGLYWWGTNLTNYLNDQPVIERLNNRELMEVIMHRVLAIDPGFDYSGPYRFFGILYTRIPGLDISQAYSYFDQAIKGNPQYLGNKVLMAEFYHQKAGNREQFHQTLNEVLNTNLTKHPEVMTDNLFYQKRAQMLLDNESSLFE